LAGQTSPTSSFGDENLKSNRAGTSRVTEWKGLGHLLFTFASAFYFDSRGCGKQNKVARSRVGTSILVEGGGLLPALFSPFDPETNKFKQRKLRPSCCLRIPHFDDRCWHINSGCFSSGQVFEVASSIKACFIAFRAGLEDAKAQPCIDSCQQRKFDSFNFAKPSVSLIKTPLRRPLSPLLGTELDRNSIRNKDSSETRQKVLIT
jgi:hypothetical protein